ncbi:MAG: hypothetical protein AAF555_10470 [Verrucomicrobiota bacterium]
MPKGLLFCLLSLLSAFLSGCQTTSPQVQARNAAIAVEPTGDWFIGRRYYVENTTFWGYLRQPRQTWEEAKLVIVNERRKRTPDRLPEIPDERGRAHGYDNNFEYRLWGRYTGQARYDPNTNLVLPEFELSRYELLNPSPGFLFQPEERYHLYQLTLTPSGGVPQAAGY